MRGSAFWNCIATAAGWLHLLSFHILLPSLAAPLPSPDSLLFAAGQSVLEDYGETPITIHLSQGENWVTTADELWHGNGHVPPSDSTHHGSNLDLEVPERHDDPPHHTSRSDHIVCDYAIVAAHGTDRRPDRILDEYRRGWLKQQPNHLSCLFYIPQAKRRSLQSEQHLTNQTLSQWRRRGTRNNPLALVTRYHACLILLSLASHGRILTLAGEMPWFMYVDGDTMFANVQTPLEVILRRLTLSAERPSMEWRICDRPYTVPCVERPFGGLNKVASIITTSPNCDQGYFTHSGAFFFQPSPVTGFLFTVLADSPMYRINTGRFRMGDQAVWDWLIQRVFGIAWVRRLRRLCQPRNRPLLRQSCSYHEALFHRQFQWKQVPKMAAMELKSGSRNRPSKVGAGLSSSSSPFGLVTVDPSEENQKRSLGSTTELLQFAVQRWLDPTHLLIQQAIEGDDLQVPDGLLLTCSRNFNAAACPAYTQVNNMDSYQCGDFLWHLFGCNKSSWHAPYGILPQTLNSPKCHELLPYALQNSD